MSCCDIFSKFGGPQSLYYSNEQWQAHVRPKQVTLGSSVLIARRHVDRFSDLTPPEWSGLGQAVQAVELRLGKAFGFEKINYLMLMMVDPHVHFHVIPRYSAPRSFGGRQWADASWPKPPDLGALAGPPEALDAIRIALVGASQ